MNELASRALVPPRPNLGPEPWADDPSIMRILVAIGAVAFLAIVWSSWRLIRHRRAGSRRSGPAPGDQADATPRGQFVALSYSIRDALIGQFGTAWRAKTTEDLSADSQLERALGPELFQELIRFLDQVDHLKFAPERSSDRDESIPRALADWKPRVADLLNKIKAKPDVRSKMKRAEPMVLNSRKSRSQPATSSSLKSSI